MHVYEGTIVTCDAIGSVRRFLVEDAGKVLFTGDILPDQYASAQRTSLDERALLPAFADSHIHFMSYALFANGLDVRDAETMEDLLASVARYGKEHRRGIIVGFGLSEHSVAERRLPTREEIDAVCPDRPVFLVKYDGHSCVVSSRLLAMLPRKTENALGFNAESGSMTQQAFFRVTNFVSSKISLPKVLGDMLRAADGLASRGIGVIHSVTGVGFPLDLDVTVESLFARGLQNPLVYRIFFQTMGVAKVRRRKLPRIGGCFATALDGCFGSADAALLEPYSNDSINSGFLYYSDEEVREFTKRANRAGLQIQMHAIGDHAFEQAVDALAFALQDHPRQDHRHTVIHACLPTERGLDACARLSIGLAVQPSFLRWRQEPLDYLLEILGDRAFEISPLQTMAAMGIRLTGGSDGPCTVPDPIHGIWAACNHPVPEESLSVQHALDLYTRNAAWGTFDDEKRGSLEPGKVADMVVLSRNPLAMNPKDLLDLRVEKLLLAGDPYRPGQTRSNLVMRSLFKKRKV